MYAIQGLWSAAQAKLPIAFIIVNNRRYEALVNFGRHFGLQKVEGTRLDDIDFCQIAQGQGIPAVRVESADALDAALATAFAANETRLVEVMVN
jgi:benzoylformate decarboxylase